MLHALLKSWVGPGDEPLASFLGALTSLVLVVPYKADIQHNSILHTHTHTHTHLIFTDRSTYVMVFQKVTQANLAQLEQAR